MRTITRKKPLAAQRNGQASGNGAANHEFHEHLVATLDAMKNGDFSARLPLGRTGLEGIITESVNSIAARLENSNSSLRRLRKQVGEQGRIGERLSLGDSVGSWAERIEAINDLVDELSQPTVDMGRVIGAVAKGDLSQAMPLEIEGRPLKGEYLRTAKLVNAMVGQLGAFSVEVIRVAREVGTEGKLGGQAQVPGVAGTWKDLTDSVNVMAANLTDQVSGIVKVVTAVANGNLRQKLTVEAKGEVAGLAETINNMTDTLATFAEQVTNVAREVGVEGRLGGQAHVPGASGTWKDLTGNVNLLAANLTTQVRAIANVATAVTKGDLTRSIEVEARGEVAELKDNINTMIYNLRGTTETNQEQDWLKTNLAKFTRMLQGQRDLFTVGKMLLSELAPLVESQQGAIYQMDATQKQRPVLRLLATYAARADQPEMIAMGEGLVGQCAVERQRILLSSVPGDYTRIHSSLGEASPMNVVVLPVLFEGQAKAVIELASLRAFSPTHISFLEQLTQSIGVVLNTIEATMRTEGLLQQSQQLTVELQSQQKELQQTNEALAQKAMQLAEQNAEVERKNREVEHARRALEAQATELALTSKYKSEFLANMSHELRTPLNSILILGQQLADNSVGNLTPKQVEFARNIHSSGSDLFNLITDILDLSKIESGTVSVDVEEIAFGSLRDSIERNFKHIAEAKNVPLEVVFSPSLPPVINTDLKRLQQILKNLLSNAFKFTSHGTVSVKVQVAEEGWTPGHSVLQHAQKVVSFAIVDSGIGIAPDKHRLIFEAFQQADAGTSRKYGGTGLGLAISRELATLLGGEIRLQSVQGQGSTFTLFLPITYADQAADRRREAAQAPSKPLPTAKDEVIEDDRDSLTPGDKRLLIVEDDPNYARVLLGMAREKGFKGIVATRGTTALALAHQYQPTAITLDVFLPDMLGWTVLNNLKHNSTTRHIPVQIISVEEERSHALTRGAFAYTVKPATAEALDHCFDKIKKFVEPHVKRLLVVEDNDIERKSIVELLGSGDIEVITASTGAEALDILLDRPFDCCVLDLRLPDMTGFDLLDRLQEDPSLRDIPVVVFTGKDLSKEEEQRLRSVAKSILVKDVQSPERLFDETALFLHRVVATLPEGKRQMLDRLHTSNDVLKGQRVLIVDDDARNIFALTTLLENQEMDVISTNNGKQAIEIIQNDSSIKVVLMDIMMPEMDGYQTMREIRKDPRASSLPILALTAKAMKGDRDKCLVAGASDYIAKPVNTNELLTLLRVWLYR